MRTHFGDADLNPVLSRPTEVTPGGGLEEADPGTMRAYAEVIATHRICAPIPPFLMPRVNADGSIDPLPTQQALQQWIERFHITGFPICFLGKDGRQSQGDPLSSERERNARYLRSMYSYLQGHHWDKMAYIYLVDEPNSREAYNDVRARSQFVREVVPGLKVLCTNGPQVRNPLWGSLVGWVDIWVPLWQTFEEAAVKRRLSVGEKIWSYTALCQGRQGTPFWELDFPLSELPHPNVAQLAFRHHRLALLEYNELGLYQGRLDQPADLPRPVQHGRLAVISGVDAGVHGFIASIRLKEIREGLEDYEYLKILERRRSRAVAEVVVKKIARTWDDWDTNGRRLLEARAEIARSILAK